MNCILPAMDSMALGKILFYLPDKGYGYLRLEGTLEEFHFRGTDLLYDSPKHGDLVRFTIEEGRKGVFARRIRRSGLA